MSLKKSDEATGIAHEAELRKFTVPLDPKRKNGTFAVLTLSGAYYTVQCRKKNAVGVKNVAGAMTLQGGSMRVNLVDAIVNEADGGVISVGDSMYVTQYGRGVLASSPVQEIYDISGANDEMLTYLKNRALELKRERRLEELSEYPPILMPRT